MLLKILLVFTLLIIFVPPVRRFVFYLLVGRQLIKEQRRTTERTPPVRDGETRVASKPTGKSGSPLRGGEYVDYEEVK